MHLYYVDTYQFNLYRLYASDIENKPYWGAEVLHENINHDLNPYRVGYGLEFAGFHPSTYSYVQSCPMLHLWHHPDEDLENILK